MKKSAGLDDILAISATKMYTSHNKAAVTTGKCIN
jgi:hypothetical protein